METGPTHLVYRIQYLRHHTETAKSMLIQVGLMSLKSCFKNKIKQMDNMCPSNQSPTYLQLDTWRRLSINFESRIDASPL